MHLDKSTSIKFEDFCSYYNSSTSQENPEWLHPIGKPAEAGDAATPVNSSRGLKPREVERNISISIEKWLKNKFREGFKALRAEFKREDTQNTGKVSRETFRRILAQFGLYLRDEESLSMFLARCSLPARGD